MHVATSRGDRRRASRASPAGPPNSSRLARADRRIPRARRSSGDAAAARRSASPARARRLGGRSSAAGAGHRSAGHAGHRPPAARLAVSDASTSRRAARRADRGAPVARVRRRASLAARACRSSRVRGRSAAPPLRAEQRAAPRRRVMRVEHELRLAHLAPLLEIAAQLLSSVHRCSVSTRSRIASATSVFGMQREPLAPAPSREQQRDAIRVDAESRARLRRVVDDDQVEILRRRASRWPFASTSFVSSANPTTTAPARRARVVVSENVRRRRERDRRAARLVFLIFDVAASGGPKVRRRGGHHEHVGSRQQLARPRAAISLGRLDRRARRRPAARRRASGPATRSTSRAATPRRRGDRHAHLAAAVIRDEAHRIDRLARRAGGDEHALARERRVAARAVGRHARRSSQVPACDPDRSPRPRRACRRPGSSDAIAELAQMRRRCACVCACAHMWSFIAGTSSTGARRRRADTR